jgi:exosome complex component CSL4
MTKKLVLPGELVAVSEEFMAGDGTYDQDGKIYSSFVGEVDLDTQQKVARVKAFNPPVQLKVGDVVYGTVRDLKETMAMITLFQAEGTDRAITGETEASLHISKISSGYTESIRNELRKTDIIRGVVIQISPSLQLATDRDNLGVLRALCARCRSQLARKGRDLYCENCERSESRKTAGDYSDPSP